MTHEFTLARATAQDLLRRPAAAVGAIALGATAAVLPRLGSPAAGVADNAALAAELGLSTWILVVAVASGLVAIHVLGPGGGGLSGECVTAPVPIGRIVVGRWLGAVSAVLVVGAAGAALGLLGWWGASAPAGADAAEWTLALATSIPTAAALGGALGAAAGALLHPDLARIVFLAYLAAARWLGSTQGDESWSHVLPDPLRLDAARDLAFGRPVGGTSLVVGALSAGVAAAAALLVAVWGARRESVWGRA